jgi:DNA topoisomerase-1
MATLLAASALAVAPAPATDREATTALGDVLAVVSAELGNTPAVCRASYVHPGVIDAFQAGDLPDLWSPAPASSPRELIAEERRLVRVLTGLS